MHHQVANKLVPAYGLLRQKAIDLLRENDLPVSDLTEEKRLFALLQGGEVVGTGGLEFSSDCAFLRSLSVKRDLQNKGLGKSICSQLEDISKQEGINCVYLLTTTAKDFFSRQGYESIERADAPESIKNTTEFSSVCPSSATVMRKCLS
jgi:amino-acid N-acetyltransferase